MKMYHVKKGTKGTLLIDKNADGVLSERDWVVTEDQYFGDEALELDPVRYHNNIHQGLFGPMTHDQASYALPYVKRGMAVFNDNEHRMEKYALAVPYIDVVVM